MRCHFLLSELIHQKHPFHPLHNILWPPITCFSAHSAHALWDRKLREDWRKVPKLFLAPVTQNIGFLFLMTEQNVHQPWRKVESAGIFFPDTLWLTCSDLILYNMTRPAYSVFEVRCSVLICAYFTFNGLFHNLVQMDKSIFKMFLLWLCSHFVLCCSLKLAFKNLYCNYTAFLINIAIFCPIHALLANNIGHYFLQTVC